jgi:hypothetical protein
LFTAGTGCALEKSTRVSLADVFESSARRVSGTTVNADTSVIKTRKIEVRITFRIHDGGRLRWPSIGRNAFDKIVHPLTDNRSDTTQ